MASRSFAPGQNCPPGFDSVGQGNGFERSPLKPVSHSGFSQRDLPPPPPIPPRPSNSPEPTSTTQNNAQENSRHYLGTTSVPLPGHSQYSHPGDFNGIAGGSSMGVVYANQGTSAGLLSGQLEERGLAIPRGNWGFGNHQQALGSGGDNIWASLESSSVPENTLWGMGNWTSTWSFNSGGGGDHQGCGRDSGALANSASGDGGTGSNPLVEDVFDIIKSFDIATADWGVGQLASETSHSSPLPSISQHTMDNGVTQGNPKSTSELEMSDGQHRDVVNYLQTGSKAEGDEENDLWACIGDGLKVGAECGEDGGVAVESSHKENEEILKSWGIGGTAGDGSLGLQVESDGNEQGSSCGGGAELGQELSAVHSGAKTKEQVHRGWWPHPETGILDNCWRNRHKTVEQGSNSGEQVYPGGLLCPETELKGLSKERILRLVPCKKVMFGAIFLSEESKRKLLARAPRLHINSRADFMVVVFRPGSKALLKLPIGRIVTMQATGEVRDNCAQAVFVTPPNSLMPKDQEPHIAVSVAEGVSPKTVLDLVKKGTANTWDSPLELTGVVGVKLENRKTVLSADEVFVQTGVNLRLIRRKLFTMLRPGREPGQPYKARRSGLEENSNVRTFGSESGGEGVSGRNGFNRHRKNGLVSSKNTEFDQSTGESTGAGIWAGIGTSNSDTGPESAPRNEDDMVLDLVDQFRGLDLHLARQLLVESDWNLEKARAVLCRDGFTEGECSSGGTGESTAKVQDSTMLRDMDGPGILHLPDDILKKLDLKPSAPCESRRLNRLGITSREEQKVVQEKLRNKAEDHRQLAKEQFRVGAEFLNLAKKAFKGGKQFQGRKYNDQSMEAHALARAHNKRAQELGFESSNLGKVNIHTVDFHTLHLAEALKMTKKVVDGLQMLVDTTGGVYKLKIITGKGKNSDNGVPVLKPQIFEFLEKEGYSPNVGEFNSGMLWVYIEPRQGSDN